MRRSRIVALLASILCVSVLLPSCKLHKKTSTEGNTIDTEETDETPRATRASETTVPSMMVTSLDQFITDGNVFSEDLPLPTPTPIPFNPISLGYTNEDDGYFSGTLENAATGKLTTTDLSVKGGSFTGVKAVSPKLKATYFQRNTKDIKKK